MRCERRPICSGSKRHRKPLPLCRWIAATACQRTSAGCLTLTHGLTSADSAILTSANAEGVDIKNEGLMPVSEKDSALVMLVVAEAVRRQPVNASTEDLVRTAAQTEDRATTALRLFRDDAAKLSKLVK
jgi:hypothetical protein